MSPENITTVSCIKCGMFESFGAGPSSVCPNCQGPTDLAFKEAMAILRGGTATTTKAHLIAVWEALKSVMDAADKVDLYAKNNGSTSVVRRADLQALMSVMERLVSEGKALRKENA